MIKQKSGTKKLISITMAIALGLSVMPKMGIIKGPTTEDVVVSSGTAVEAGADTRVLGGALDDYIGTLGGDYTDAQKAKWKTSKASTHQMRNVMYYGDWSVWGGQGTFYISQIPARYLTHLNYAFATPDPDGNIRLTDTDAAFNTANGFGGGATGINGRNGQIPGISQLRANNPNLRIGTSFGGWTLGRYFHNILLDTAPGGKRENFIKNLIQWTRYTGGDFIDLDWEYPVYSRKPDTRDLIKDQGTPDNDGRDKDSFVAFLDVLRKEVDKAGLEDGKYYELSAATPAGKDKCEMGMNLPRIYQALDFVNVMTYDLHGAFDGFSGHQTGLYRNPAEERITEDEYGKKCKENNVTVSEAVEYYLTEGSKPADENKPEKKLTRAQVAAKTVVGVAMYTRGWENVNDDGGATKINGERLPGLFGKANTATRAGQPVYDAGFPQELSRGALNHAALKDGEGGRRAGVWGFGTIEENSTMTTLKGTYKDLVWHWDDWAQAPYLYSEKSGAFFTYDDLNSVAAKGRFVHGERMNAQGGLVPNGGEKLGGFISWMASNDRADDGTWGGSMKERVVLTRACKEALIGKGDSVKFEGKDVITVPRNVSAAVTKEGSKLKLSVTNNGNKHWASSRESSMVKLEQSYNGLPHPTVVLDGKFSTRLMVAAGQGTIETKQEGNKTVATYTSDGNNSPVLAVNKTINIELECIEPNCKSYFHGTEKELSRATLAIKVASDGEIYGHQPLFNKDWSQEEPFFVGIPDKTWVKAGDLFDPKTNVKGIEPETQKELPWNDDAAGVVGSAHVDKGDPVFDNGTPGRYVFKYTAMSSYGVKKVVRREVFVYTDGTQKPVFSGIGDTTIAGWTGITVNTGKIITTPIDLKKGITAKGERGEDLTGRIAVAENGFTVKTDDKEDKTFTVKYTVKDDRGNESVAYRKITVLKIPAWEQKTYQGGAVLAYNNHVWYANWDTSGSRPSADGSGRWTDLGEIVPGKEIPIISGVPAKRTVPLGVPFGREEALKNVTAEYNGSSISKDDINIDFGDLKTTKEDEYEIIYSVEIDGMFARESCILTVVDDTAPKVGWSNGKVYLAGEILSGGNKYYVARSRNQGKEPSANPAVWRETTYAKIDAKAVPYSGKNTFSLTIVKIGDTLYQSTRFTTTHPTTLKGWREIAKPN